jgi:hypothetical protein
MIQSTKARTIPAPKPRKRRVGGSGGKVTYPPPRWRFGDLLTGLGHESQIASKLEQRGYPRVPLDSIVSWRLRNSIPAYWVPILIQMGLDERLIARIEDLRIK